jgi:superfamily II DNA or RNA helicase
VQDAKLSEFFTNKKVTLHCEGYSSPVDFLICQGYLARPEFRQILNEHELDLSSIQKTNLIELTDIHSSVLALLAEDDYRNLIIFNELKGLVSRHQRVIVFSTTVAHAALLASLATLEGIAARTVTSNTSSKDRADAISWYKATDSEPRVLINFGVLTTGFDAPKTSAALIARPTKSLVLYSQMVGRAIRGRLAGGNENAEIVTVVDTQLPGFDSPAAAFENWDDVWQEAGHEEPSDALGVN